MKTKHLIKGFTLVELMIVIVILGVLMGAVVPRITGGQARSRDTASISDLGQIAQAFESFYGDHGRYPGINNKGICLEGIEIKNGTGDDDIDDLSAYFKGSEMITAPSNKRTIKYGTGDADKCEGDYYYKPLTANGIARSGFALVAKMDETGGNLTEDNLAVLHSDATDTIDDSTDGAALLLDDKSSENEYYMVLSQ